MAELPLRASLSVSSELQNMARMRAQARELSAKDAVWQGQLLSAGHPVAVANAAAAAAAVAATPSATMPPPLPPAALTPPAAAMHSPSLCASPVSPTEMSAPTPLAIRPAIAKNPPRPKRGSGKIRRRRLTKEEEARFPVEELTDLTGTTAARSRKMSREEHELMLHKRRLRNRESAARSRDRQRRTTNELAAEVDDLKERTRHLAESCERASNAARAHANRANTLERLNAELVAQITALRGAAGAASPNVPVGAGSVARPPAAPRQPPAITVTASSAGLGNTANNSMTSMPMVTATAAMGVNVGNAIGMSSTAGVNPPPLAVSNSGAGASTSGLVTLAHGGGPAVSTDTLDKILGGGGEQTLPGISRPTSFLRMPSWQSLRNDGNAAVHAPSGNLRKPQSSSSILAFMDLEGAGNASLSQDMASLLPASAAPL